MRTEQRLRDLLYAGPPLLLAFGLRTYRLSWQSLWYDEGNSAFMTGRSLPEIIAGAAADIHPPLYYILLSWWSHWGGGSEFGLRFLSVIFGLLLVAVVYKLGQKLFVPQAGLAAAAIAAISPFLVYYSQEARMYMQGAFLCALAGLFFVKALEKDRYWAAYALTAAAAIYTQYYALGPILALNVFFVVAVMWRSGRGLRARWLAANAVVAVLYLPWLPTLAVQAATWPRGYPLPAGQDWLADAVFLGPLLITGPATFADPVAQFASFANMFLATALLAVVALAWPVLSRKLIRQPPGSSGLWLGYGLALTAVLVSWPILLVPFWRPNLDVFNPKFLTFGLPYFYIWMGAGAVSLTIAGRHVFQALALPLRRTKGQFGRVPWAIPLAFPTLAALFFLVQGTWPAHERYYAGASAQASNRGDYRNLAGYIEAQAEPGDSIVLNAPGQTEVFSYYYRGPLPVFPLPHQRPLDEYSTQGDLEAIASGSDRVWLLLWGQQESDPQWFVERWLNNRGYKTVDRWFKGVHAYLYVMPRTGPERRLAVSARVENYGRLAAVGLPGAPQAAGEPLARASAGGILTLSLYWEATSPMPERYKVFVHLLGPGGTLWGQHDGEPGGGSRPTTDWRAGESIVDNHGLPVLPGTPPGRYEVELGLYDPATGRRLPIYDDARNEPSDRLVLNYVEVTKPSFFPARESLDMEQAVEASYPDFGLLGYEFFKLGTERGSRDFQTGDIAHLALWWRAESSPPAGYWIRVALLDGSDREQGMYQGTVEVYPPGNWSPGEIVRDLYKIALPVSPGAYRVAVSVTGPLGKPVQPAGPGLKLAGGKLLLTDFQVK